MYLDCTPLFKCIAFHSSTFEKSIFSIHFMSNLKLNAFLLTLTAFLFLHQNARSQETKMYKGPYSWGDNEGEAEYAYYEKDGKRIYHGSFKMTGEVRNTQAYLTYTYNGQFSHGEASGTWKMQTTGEAQNNPINSVVIGNFSNGVPNGSFVNKVVLVDSAVTRLTYMNGKPYGQFYHYNGLKGLRLNAQFSKNGFLTGKLEHIQGSSSEVINFDDQNRAIIASGFSNGNEIKRIDVLKTATTLDPIYVSWDTTSFEIGNKILESFWTKNSFGYFSKISTFSAESLSKFSYITFQKLKSFKDAELFPVEDWKAFNTIKVVSHAENEKMYNRWSYLLSNEYKKVSPEIRKYIIKSDLKSYDSINAIFNSIQFANVDKAYKELLALIGDQQLFYSKQLKQLKTIDSLFNEVNGLKFGSSTMVHLPRNPEIGIKMKTTDSLVSNLKTISATLTGGYKLHEWQAKVDEIDAMKRQVIWTKNDTTTVYLNALNNWISSALIPWLTEDNTFRKRCESEKDFEDLLRIHSLLIDDRIKSMSEFSLPELTRTLVNLKAIQEKLAGFVANPTENYKPVRRDLKKALTATEIRTILNLN